VIDSLRLFLIESEDDIALLMRKSLERAGHQVKCCRTAADALIVLGQTSFDLVILNRMLNDMEGVALLEQLTREEVNVPVLMIGAGQGAAFATQALLAGALDYVVMDGCLSFLLELPKRACDTVVRHRLKHANELLIRALECACDGILITDLQGTILNVNKAMEEMTGYSRAELMGQTPRLLNSGSHSREVFATMWRTILDGHSWQGELTNRRKDGTQFLASITISPIIDQHGRLTHFVGIERNITEHRKL